MNTLGRDIACAVRVDWTPTRSREAELGLRKRQRRRAVVRGAAIGTLTAALVCAALWSASDRTETHAIAQAPQVAPASATASSTASASRSAEAPVATAPANVAVRFVDQSTARPDDANARLRVVTDEPTRTVVELAAGGGRFEIVANPQRAFHLRAGNVHVQAFSAKFAAARFEQRVRVEVWEGTVHVSWDGDQRELGAGETATFPPETPAKHRSERTGAKRHAATGTKRVASAGEATWRELARKGDYNEAYAAMSRPDAPAVRDVPEELLLAADVKRLSKHPADAVTPLRQILRDHASDPRAPLAAFTLGRVLLDELARPGEAATAFAQVTSLAPDGALAEDALARRVEALVRAGDAASARRVAEQYVERYPDGRMLRSVRRFGGL